jgi:hypothetical protein
VAVAAARAVGLAYTAVDVVRAGPGYAVLEVNGHPNFEIAWDACRLDVGALIAELVVARGRAWRRRRAAALGPPRLHAARSRSMGLEDWAAVAPSA